MSAWIALANAIMLVHFAVVCIPTYTLAVSITSEINRKAIVQGAKTQNKATQQLEEYNSVFARVEQVCVCPSGMRCRVVVFVAAALVLFRST